jgi:lauroyl/myristoyl acyltransferase
MASIAIARGFVQPRRLRRALEWASHYRHGVSGRWRLALSLLAYDGRFKAAHSLLGVRDAEQLRAHFTVDGEAHLRQAMEKGGTMLLGFHVGPRTSWLALRLLGFGVNAFIGHDYHRFRRPGLRAILDSAETMRPQDGGPAGRAAWLHRARRLLVEGKTIFITADRVVPQDTFEIAVAGATAMVGSGWLALRRHTTAATLPVLMHREGRRGIVTIYPPLPPPRAGLAADMDACRAELTTILSGYARRFPEQCRGLVMRLPAIVGMTMVLAGT